MVLFRSLVLGGIALVFAGGSTRLVAQPAAPETTAATPAAPEQLSQAELLKSFVQVREQLHATQQAMANNQLAAEAKAKASTTAITQQLDSIKAALAAERENQQAESQRWQAERERQQAALKQADAERERLQAASELSSQHMLFIASSFGCAGLLAMILVPIFQWRAINRITQADALRAQPNALVTVGGLLPDDAGGQATALANQRLMTAIDRIEQRIVELETTATPTSAAAIADSPRGNVRSSAETHRLPGPSGGGEKVTRIAVLLAKGRALLSTNKPAEALACYDEILTIDARSTEALLRRGVALERLARDTEAIASYDRAIVIDSKMALAYLHKGGVCQRLARHDEAVACYERALQVEEAAR